MTVKILKAEPSAVTTGMQLVFFTRKSTAKNPVKDEDKYRAVEILPWAEFATVEETMKPLNSVFLVAVKEAVEYAAGEILRSFCDSNTAAAEFDEQLLTLNAVVAKMQTQQTSQRMKGEQIENWFDASATKDACIKNYTTGEGEAAKTDTAKMQLVRKKYASLASNNAALKETEVMKLLAFLQDGDKAHPVYKFVANKLAKIQEEFTKADEL